MEKIYHIYAKGQCIYHSLSENKFSETWEMLHRMVELLDINIRKEDLNYEELVINKQAIMESSY
jgi:hypothetical protein